MSTDQSSRPPADTPARLPRSNLQEPSPLLPYFTHHPSTFELAGVGVQLAAQLPFTNEEKLAWVTEEVFAAYRQLGVETVELLHGKVVDVVEHALTTWKALLPSLRPAPDTTPRRSGLADLLYCFLLCARSAQEAADARPRAATVATDTAPAAPFPLLKNSIARP